MRLIVRHLSVGRGFIKCVDSELATRSKMTVFLAVLVFAASLEATSICNTLFVLDASRTNIEFRTELLNVLRIARLLYSSSGGHFGANYWLYGDFTKQQQLPDRFYTFESDFMSAFAEASQIGGYANVSDIAPILNVQNPRSLIVLVTSDMQQTIEDAGMLYTRKSDTVGISTNININTSAISRDQFLHISSILTIKDAIIDACKHFKADAKTTTLFENITGSLLSFFKKVFALDAPLENKGTFKANQLSTSTKLHRTDAATTANLWKSEALQTLVPISDTMYFKNNTRIPEKIQNSSQLHLSIATITKTLHWLKDQPGLCIEIAS